MPETFSFSVERLGERALRLDFSSQLGRFLGVRLNTYSDSVERAGALCPGTWDLSPLSSHVIQRHAAVQKLSFSSPTRCPFNAMAAARWFPMELRAPVFCGRAPGADAPNLCFVIASFVPEDVGREIERAGGGVKGS